MSKIILKVKKEKLVGWYFDNWDRHDYSSYVAMIRRSLMRDGEFSVTIQDIVDQLGYISSDILEGEHDVHEYEDWDELILI